MNKSVLISSILALSILIVLSGCYLLRKSENYYGIDTTTDKKFVFIIDLSGSMEGKAETNLQGDIVSEATSEVGNIVGNKVGGIAGSVIKNQTQDQVTKLGKAKKELIPTIRGLSEDCYFTIITFENAVDTWRKDLVQATSTNKNLAINYINNLESGGGTNIYEALTTAFDIAGDGVNNNSSELKVQTIFLLSDGEPTAGKITDSDKICTEISSLNSLKRIKIHTVGLGEDCDEVFMKKLAQDNGGNYIDK